MASNVEVVVTLRSRFPEYVESVTGPIGRGLSRTGLRPNTVTTLGLVLTVAAAAVVATGEPVIGGWILVLGGLMDIFDGAIARATSTVSPFGGFYDSVTDRISDGVILGGMAWWLRDEPRLFALVLVALVAAEVTSYVRAKAEAIDLECSVGIMERAERAVLLMAALIFSRWLLEPILWVLAIGGAVTVVQRIHHVWCQIARDLPEELVLLTMHDRAWSRAFKRAARTFYGAQNYHEAERAQLATGLANGDGRIGRVSGAPADGHMAADGLPDTTADGHGTPDALSDATADGARDHDTTADGARDLDAGTAPRAAESGAPQDRSGQRPVERTNRDAEGRRRTGP